MPRRSKPMMIAPLIPLLGVIGIFGLQTFSSSRYRPAFIIVWTLAMTALALYVLKQAMLARRLGKGTR